MLAYRIDVDALICDNTDLFLSGRLVSFSSYLNPITLTDRDVVFVPSNALTFPTVLPVLLGKTRRESSQHATYKEVEYVRGSLGLKRPALNSDRFANADEAINLHMLWRKL